MVKQKEITTLSNVLTEEEMKFLSENKKALEICELYLKNCEQDHVIDEGKRLLGNFAKTIVRDKGKLLNIWKNADQEHLYRLFSSPILKKIENSELAVSEVMNMSTKLLEFCQMKRMEIREHSPLAIFLEHDKDLSKNDIDIKKEWLKDRNKLIHLLFEPIFEQKLQNYWDQVFETLESLTIKNDKGQTFLQYVVESSNALLLNRILDPEKKWFSEKDLLEQDTEGNSLLHFSIEKGNQEIIKILVKNKALLELKNIYDQTPLLLACKEGSVEIMAILLKEEAAVTVKDKDGNSALYYLTRYSGMHKGDGKGPQLLLNYLRMYNKDYSINQENNAGITPFIVALQHRNLPIMEKLYDYDNRCSALTNEKAKEAFLNAVSEGDMKVFDFFAFRTKGKNVFENVEDKEGNNALNVAAASGMMEAVKHIMKHNSFKEVIKGETTPLHLSCKNDHIPLTAFLVKNRRYNDVPDEDGNLPLHVAIAEGEKDLTIIEHVIDALKLFPKLINFKNKAGKTPLDVAIEKGDKKIAELLEDVEALTSTGKTLKQAIREDKPIFSFEDKIKKQREEPKEQGHARS